MPNESVDTTDTAPRHDPREAYQERAKGTVDLDLNGEATFTVSLVGEMRDSGVGLLGAADAGNGNAELTDVSPDQVTVAITGGTDNQVGVEWELVVSEDGFYRDSSDALDGGSAP